MIPRLRHAADEPFTLPARGSLPPTRHVFAQADIHAIHAALAARRPLLVRGEPGTGKSQLARAAAYALGSNGWPFVHEVIDAKTEAQDLFWRFDAVRRLADAQVQGLLGAEDQEAVRRNLAGERYLEPGPLWWAFDWASARAQAKSLTLPPPAEPAGWDIAEGCVVLLDEIDKADPSVPNGLLEALGNGEFPAHGREPVKALGAAPLVVVTTNEERSLPDAFLRRCLVHQLRLPSGHDELVAFLVQRGGEHFESSSETVRRQAAEQLAADRAALARRGLSLPGQAEYLDLLRALQDLADSEPAQLELLAPLVELCFRKHPDERRE